MVVEYDAGRLDGNHPARAEENGFVHAALGRATESGIIPRNEKPRLGGAFRVQAARRGYCLGVPLMSTTTRRFGSRHSISALRFLMSGQLFTCIVSPKP